MRLVSLLALTLLLTGCFTLEPNTRTVALGTVYVNTSVTSGPVTWTNTETPAVEVIGVTTTFAAGSPFSLQPANFTASTLAKGQACNPVRVIFAPTTAGPFTGTMETSHIAALGKSATSRPVSIFGVGAWQAAMGSLTIGGNAFTPNSALDFGAVSVQDAQGKALRVDLANTGTKPITITTRFINGGAGFSVEAPTPFVVPPLPAKLTIKIRFKPGRVGRFNDAVDFLDAGSGSNVCGTALTGMGTE
jgi:hypothetical protein